MSQYEDRRIEDRYAVLFHKYHRGIGSKLVPLRQIAYDLKKKRDKLNSTNELIFVKKVAKLNSDIVAIEEEIVRLAAGIPMQVGTHSGMACPKCGETSGNDWSQCGYECPMPQSPYYKP
jgi:hypothetical protein